MQAYAHASDEAAAATSAPSRQFDPSDDSAADRQQAAANGSAAESAPETPVALRFVGATAAGDFLVCARRDPNADGEADRSDVSHHFLLPIDERVRAAITGSHARDTEWENPMTPQLRPREIQNRIRAGASVEQVAAAAGCTAERIEGFAYPVLLERATIADKARATLPLRGATLGSAAAASAALTLEEIATQTLIDRGQNTDVTWDAFKDERGWTVSLTWTVGRTENRAEWAYVAQPSGDLITARNADAAELLEPSRSPLREVGGSLGVDSHREVQSSPVDSHDIDAPEERTGAASPAPTTPARRGHRPPMPSWEDVLLGTRSGQAGGHR